jgi:hypothetical protein
MSLLLTEFTEKKLFEMRSYMFNAQITALWYRCTNWEAGLNPSIPVNMREYFRLTDFWTTLYISTFHYSLPISLPLSPVLSQMYPVKILKPYYFKIQFNTFVKKFALESPKWSISLQIFPIKIVYKFFICTMRATYSPYFILLFHCPNYIWWRVQVMKRPSMQFTLPFCNLFLSKYSSPHAVPEYLGARPSLTPIQNKWNYILHTSNLKVLRWQAALWNR